MADAVTCSLLPAKMRELQEEWNSSGSVAAFDFGLGLITATNIGTDVEISSGSLETRPDSLALDYQTTWAFGPIETGSLVSGSLTSSWKAENSYSAATQTGSVLLARENEAGDNWRVAVPLFTYSGSAIEELDLTFDQAGRAVVCAERIDIIDNVSQSLVYLFRFAGAAFEFSPIATGSTPRVLLDDTVDTIASDVLVFYIRSITSENSPELIFTTGSGISGDLITSLCAGDLIMSLNVYHKSDENINEIGNFSSQAGLGASIGITGTFNIGVSSLGATVVGPDFNGNQLRVFDAGGSLIDSVEFLRDSSSTEITKDTRIISGNGTPIRSFQLQPGTGDYVGYDQIIIEPTSSCPPVPSGTFSTQQVYMRIQRELFAVENAIPLVEGRFQEKVFFIFGQLTGSVGLLDPEDAGLTGRLFGTSSICPRDGIAEGTISGSPCGVILPNVSQSILSGSIFASFIPRGQWLAGSGTDLAAFFPDMINGNLANRWVAGAPDTIGQQFIINFQTTESIGGFYMDHFSANELPGTFDVSSAIESGSFVSRAISISGSNGGADPLVCMFTGAFDAVFLKFELKSLAPQGAIQWGIADLNVFDGFTAFSFSGSLTGSHTGTIQGFVSGCMTGSMTHSGDMFGSVTGTTSQSIVDGSEFLYELFLEDVVKLTDGRVALYVSRRNIDSGSNDFGEYRVNKFETILFPHQIIDANVEDQWSASADLLFATLSPILLHDVFDIEAIQSISLFVPSGSSSLRTILIDHTVFDIETIQSISLFVPSGSSSLRTVILEHTVFDIETIQSISLFSPSGSSSLIQVVTTHSVFDGGDIDSFVSYSCFILSGSFEVL